MKRIILVAICALLTFCLLSCAAREQAAPSEEAAETPVLGRWTINTETAPHISGADKALYEKAYDKNEGIDILTPIAEVATQVVAGTNHCYLCCCYDDGDGAGWYFLTIFEDLQGDAETISLTELDIMDVKTIDNPEAAVVGDWEINNSEGTVLPGEAQEAFNKAMDGFVGVGYSPIALLATQPVSGTNYRILCSGTTVTAEPVTSVYLLDIYADLNGNAEITDIKTVDIVKYADANS